MSLRRPLGPGHVHIPTYDPDAIYAGARPRQRGQYFAEALQRHIEAGVTLVRNALLEGTEVRIGGTTRPATAQELVDLVLPAGSRYVEEGPSPALDDADLRALMQQPERNAAAIRAALLRRYAST